jgi:Type II secretion system (T2SS), protein G
MLGNLSRHRPDEVADRKNAAQSDRRRFPLSIAFCLLLLVVNVASIWVTTRLANRSALHQMVERDAHRLAARIERYRGEKGLYPDAATWEEWSTGSDATELLDPWSRPYLYDVNERAYSIRTYGADGQPGGTEDDGDLTFVFPYATPRL